MMLRKLFAAAFALSLFSGTALAQETRGTSPLSGVKGGTGNAFMQFSGPSTSLKTYTLPNASVTLAALSQIQTWTGAQSFADGTLILLGATSGASTLKAPATGGGTATLFAGSDTIAGLAAPQTLTNKTFNCANNTCTVRIANDVTGLGTGVATALGNAVNASGGFITFGNAVSSVTPGAGLVSSVAAACSQLALTTTGTVSKAECVNAQTGTSYTFVDGDRAKLVTGSNAAAQSYSLPQAGAASAFVAGWYVDVCNVSTNLAGIITITPTTSTINGAASFKLQPAGPLAPSCARVVSDGTNYQVVFNATGDQLPGTTTNDNANAGNVGEFVSSTVVAGSGVSLSSGTPANITSISLTAGDWEVSIQSGYGGTTTSISGVRSSISTTSNTEDTTLDRWNAPPIAPTTNVLNTFNLGFTVGPSRWSLSTTTTLFYVGRCTFTGGTCLGFGYMRARRVR